MLYTVYVIRYKDDIVYIGMSKDIKQRQKEHNKGLQTRSNRKELYVYLRDNNVSKVKLEVLKTFSTRYEAQLFETWLILTFYFSDNYMLKQSLPKRIYYF